MQILSWLVVSVSSGSEGGGKSVEWKLNKGGRERGCGGRAYLGRILLGAVMIANVMAASEFDWHVFLFLCKVFIFRTGLG